MRDLFIKTVVMARKGALSQEEIQRNYAFLCTVFDDIERGKLSARTEQYVQTYDAVRAVMQVQAIELRNQEQKIKRRILLTAMEARLNGKKTFVVCSDAYELQRMREDFFELAEKHIKHALEADQITRLLERGEIRFIISSSDLLDFGSWRIKGISKDQCCLLATDKAIAEYFKLPSGYKKYADDSNISAFVKVAEYAIENHIQDTESKMPELLLQSYGVMPYSNKKVGSFITLTEQADNHNHILGIDLSGMSLEQKNMYMDQLRERRQKEAAGCGEIEKEDPILVSVEALRGLPKL
ncbi:hypothetical protein [Acinetobacter sp. ANC 3813]|uniref:hypothetical protein n=1 Tax=Acinetobacter sp. ANC 3813 TaxID=1977873 RepID=UPI000A3345C3|nr:hypothetical protein [Acinetobacter sp. ANC 3813]OTG87915.1 hypothetical protein B9T34_16410 [Acinetobacter sp. ANC 3813]